MRNLKFKIIFVIIFSFLSTVYTVYGDDQQIIGFGAIGAELEKNFPDTTYSDFTLSVVSNDDLRKVILNIKEDRKIPHFYLEDGCNFRAWAMASYFRESGFKVGYITIREKTENFFFPIDPIFKYSDVHWKVHIAVFIIKETKDNDLLNQLLVIDLSISPFKPLHLLEWLKNLSPNDPRTFAFTFNEAKYNRYMDTSLDVGLEEFRQKERILYQNDLELLEKYYQELGKDF